MILSFLMFTLSMLGISGLLQNIQVSQSRILESSLSFDFLHYIKVPITTFKAFLVFSPHIFFSTLVLAKIPLTFSVPMREITQHFTPVMQYL